MGIAQWRVLVVSRFAQWPLGHRVQSVRPVLGHGAQVRARLVPRVRQIRWLPLVEASGPEAHRGTCRVAIAPHRERADQGDRQTEEAPSGHTVATAVRTDSAVPRSLALKGPLDRATEDAALLKGNVPSAHGWKSGGAPWERARASSRSRSASLWRHLWRKINASVIADSSAPWRS